MFKSMKLSGKLFGAFILLFLCGPAAYAVLPNTLYMNDLTANSTLYTVNSLTGAKTLVGAMGIARCTDIAFRGPTLFGVTFTQFLRVNPNTGAATVIGNMGANFNDINALGVNPATGKIFAAGFRAPAKFITINPATGRGTLIGTYGPGLSSAGDLVFKNGVLFASLNRAGFVNTWLARISPTTGRATLIGDIGFRDVFGLALKSGVLFGATRDGRVLRINTTTGRGTLIGSNGAIQAGLTTSP